MQFHVSKDGNDKNPGLETAPFLTIQRAADVAESGDHIIVHEGIYREWVKPVNGGTSENQRIVYETAEGECVSIRGSELVSQWTRVEDSVWKAEIPNSLFGQFHPFLETVSGDWLVSPLEMPVHLGEVYLNGHALYEAFSLEEVKRAEKRVKSAQASWWNIEEYILEPEWTIYQWYAEVKEDTTALYVNFHKYNPNEECVEINVRKSCFMAEKTGINYITVRGFEICQAATPWAPPTANQVGMIGPYWAKGWVIEENDIHDAKCSAVSLGKEKSTGDNEFTRDRKKPGYQYQMEAVFLARHIGWSRERIGSHIVRNNRIYDCGQNGIVGHMGCIFSEIYGNEIYRIAVKHEFFGHEIAGIKLHAAIDASIHHNYIHDCSLGTWLDWEAQGTRISGNVYDKNRRDFMIEVTHGPCLVDNNIFTAEYTFDNAAQGTAFVHNLCGGFMNHYDVRNRSTPYHLPHSTEVLGTAVVYGSDDRWYQNIFIGGKEEGRCYGTSSYDGAPVSMEEYIERINRLGEGDVELFEQVRQPAHIQGNAYFAGAEAFDREEKYYSTGENPHMQLQAEEDGVYLSLTLPDGFFDIETMQINSEILSKARMTEQRYENPDGSGLTIAEDMLGAGRKGHPTIGPVETLKAGENHVCIWRSPRSPK